MAKIQKNFIKGRMNKSVDERLVPQGEYIDALNVRLGSTEGTEIGAVENSKGNELIVELIYDGNPLSSNAKCIGAYEDGVNETIYWFVNDEQNISSPTGNVDLIVSYNTRTSILFYHVVSTSVLNFNKDYLINGINLIDDLLFFTDNLNPPRKININRTYAQPLLGVDQVTEQDIGVIVAPPLKAPVLSQFQLGGGENYMEDLFLSFAYRWQYEDGEYSALSPFSQVAFTPGPFQLNYDTYDNDSMQNIFNSVSISFDTGGKNVKDVDIIFKFSTSQSVNVIERYNKVNQGWLDNVNQSIDFTNKKIYTTLPEEQLLRLYDNVPKIAQAQTIMGNRVMYGNYVDGYDIVNENGKQIYLDYNLSLITESLTNEEIQGVRSNYSYDIDVLTSVVNAKASINFGGLDLINGSQIGIVFNYQSQLFGGDPTYDDGTQPLNQFDYTFLFNLQQDYPSVHDLVTSPEFVAAVSDFEVNCADGFSVTDVYNCGITSKSGWIFDGFGVTTTNQGFVIESSLGSDIVSIIIPGLRFEEIANPGTFAYEYLSSIETTGLYSLTSSKQSLHSNRDYEIAVVYMDDYGRSTTALVDTNNTVYVPCQNSINKNTIRVQLNSYPPFWATKYKFVVKESKTGYRTIYSNIFFREETTGDVYYKLEGDNRDKVKDNESLYVKADTGGPVLRCTKTKVLEFGSKTEDFLCTKDADGVVISGTCGQPSGTYMKLKPSNFNANLVENAFIDRTDNGGPSSYSSASVSCSVEDETNPGNYLDIDIPAGSLITFRFTTTRFERGSRCGGRTYDYDKTFTSGNDYTDLASFVTGEQIDFTNGISGGTDSTINVINQPNTIYPFYTSLASGGQTYITFQRDASDNRLLLVIQTGTPKCGGVDQRGSYESVQIILNRAATLNIFETEPIQANDELYYENEQVFDISGGFHLSGNSAFDQNQTAVLPAVIDLTFFNCYVFGNGVESDKVLDALTTPTLSLGEKVTSVSEEEYKEIHRLSDITYSGVYNQESGLNKLNQFNLALSNFKTLERSFGPLRKLHSRQTDILALQEDKISYVLVGKNLLSDAAAGGAITSIPEVLGTQLARIEEFGISNNPESFSSYGYDVYFTDSKRSSVINLKGGSAKSDQLNVISQAGMRSWFRDLFTEALPTQKLGGFDPYMNEYVLSSTETLVPTPPIERQCGYQLIQQSSNDAVIFNLNLTTIIGDVDLNYNVSVGSVNIKVVYNGITEIDNIVTGVGVLQFTKNLNNPILAQVFITPQALSTYDITFGCSVAPRLTVKQIVINNAGDVSLTTTSRYNWKLGSDLSPFSTNSIVLESDGISLFVEETGEQSFGSIPTEGSVVNMQMIQEKGQTFVFNAASDNMKYLISNVNYNETDINTLIPLLVNSGPVVGGPLNYVSKFTYTNLTNQDYLYLVWDLRSPSELSFCYDATSAISACCDCSTPPALTLFPIVLEYGSISCAAVCSNFGANNSGTFYVDVGTPSGGVFALSTKIYLDSAGTSFAPSFFYTDGTECRPVDGNGNLGITSGCGAPPP